MRYFIQPHLKWQQVVAVVGSKGFWRLRDHPWFLQGSGSLIFRGCDDIAREGFLGRGQVVERRRDAEPHRSPRVSAAPGIRRGAPHGVLVVVPGGGRGGRRGHFIDEGLVVTVGVSLVDIHRRSSHLRGKIPSVYRVDVMGKVLEKHRAVYRGNPLEKALVYGVGGPSVAERR